MHMIRARDFQQWFLDPITYLKEIRRLVPKGGGTKVILAPELIYCGFISQVPVRYMLLFVPKDKSYILF